MDALHNGFDRINLVRAHHHQLLLAGHQHHVAADHFAQRTLGQEFLGKAVQMGDFLVVFAGKLVERQKALVGIKAEVAAVVVGEVPGIAAVADDEELHEAQQCFGVAVAGIVLVIDDLLHGPAWADCQGFQLDLHHRHAIDEQDHIVAVMAVVGVDAQLIDHLEGVLAPVLDVDQGVKQRRAVVPLETVPFAQDAGRHEYVRRNDLLHQSGELILREMDPVERLELLAEVLFQRGTVADIRAIGIFEIG